MLILSLATYRDFGCVFPPLPGAVMDADQPPPGLFITTGAGASGIPTPRPLMTRYGQLPPLRHAVGAPSSLSSAILNAANGLSAQPCAASSSKSMSIPEAGQSGAQGGPHDDFDFDEVIVHPSRKNFWFPDHNMFFILSIITSQVKFQALNLSIRTN